MTADHRYCDTELKWIYLPQNISIVYSNLFHIFLSCFPARLPIPVITRDSSCSASGSSSVSRYVLLCSVFKVCHMTLSWYKDNSLLSSIIVSDVNYLCLNLDYKDNGNYSCVVSDSFINETKNLVISELCSGMPVFDLTSPRMYFYMILPYSQRFGHKPWRSRETN